MTPHVFGLPVAEGTRLTLCVLYADADPKAVRAWAKGKAGEPPFVWRAASHKELQRLTRRSKTSVADDLKLLKQLGEIRRGERDGRQGWELLGGRDDAGHPVSDARPAGIVEQTRDRRLEVGRVVTMRQANGYIAAVERVEKGEMHLIGLDGTRRKVGLGQNGRHLTTGPYKLTEYFLRPLSGQTMQQALLQFVKESRA